MEDSRRDSAVRELESIPVVDFPSAVKPIGPDHGSTGRSSSDYAWLLWEKRRLLYKVVVRSLLVSTVVAVLIPSRYESTSRIMPPDQTDGAGLLALLAGRAAGGGTGSAGLASLAGSFLGMKTTGALFVDLARSRTVQENVVDRFNLQKVYHARYKQDARKLLDARTEVSEDRKSGVIDVTVTDNDKQRARDLAQAYIQELDHLVSQVSTSSARRERIFIEQRLTTVKSDLENAEKEFSAFASKNTTLDIKEQAKAEVEAGAVLQGQLFAAEAELQGLEQIYTENNVRVRYAQARIAELRHQLEKFGGTDASLGTDSSGSSQNLYPSIRKLPLLGVTWADLYRKVKIQETVYELLNQQYELTRIQEAKEIPTIRIIDPANFPDKKSWPPRLLIILIFTGIAFVSTAIGIVASDRWHEIDAHDANKLLALAIWQSVTRKIAYSASRLHLDGVSSHFSRSRTSSSN